MQQANNQTSRHSPAIIRCLRTIHLSLCVLIPTLFALCYGFTLWLFSWNKRFALNQMGRFLGWFGLLLARVKLDIRNHKIINQHRPALFVFNHRSGLDPIILCRLIQRDVIGIAKQELKHHPLLGPLLRFGDTLFVDRHHQQVSSNDMTPAIEALQSGLSIAIAPEGTRLNAETATQRKLGQFRKGAFRISQQSGSSIVPIVIHDADACLRPGSSQLYSGTIHIEILEPISPETQSQMSVLALTEYVHQRMLLALEQGRQQK